MCLSSGTIDQPNFLQYGYNNQKLHKEFQECAIINVETLTLFLKFTSKEWFLVIERNVTNRLYCIYKFPELF